MQWLEQIFHLWSLKEVQFHLRKYMCIMRSSTVVMGVARILYMGGPVGDCPKFFSRGVSKVVKFVFYPSKLKKQPFIAKDFKIQGGKSPPCPPRSDAHDCSVMDGRDSMRRWKRIRGVINWQTSNLLPVQVIPFTLYPFMQEHIKLPTLFVHDPPLARLAQLSMPNAHSSISVAVP